MKPFCLRLDSLSKAQITEMSIYLCHFLLSASVPATGKCRLCKQGCSGKLRMRRLLCRVTEWTLSQPIKRLSAPLATPPRLNPRSSTLILIGQPHVALFCRCWMAMGNWRVWWSLMLKRKKCLHARKHAETPKSQDINPKNEFSAGRILSYASETLEERKPDGFTLYSSIYLTAQMSNEDHSLLSINSHPDFSQSGLHLYLSALHVHLAVDGTMWWQPFFLRFDSSSRMIHSPSFPARSRRGWKELMYISSLLIFVNTVHLIIADFDLNCAKSWCS